MSWLPVFTSAFWNPLSSNDHWLLWWYQEAFQVLHSNQKLLDSLTQFSIFGIIVKEIFLPSRNSVQSHTHEVRCEISLGRTEQLIQRHKAHLPDILHQGLAEKRRVTFSINNWQLSDPSHPLFFKDECHSQIIGQDAAMYNQSYFSE